MSWGVVVESSSYRELDGNVYMPDVVIGGIFALVAMVLSAHLIFQHLRSYTKPEEQKWIVGILLMVPVYATDSIRSLSYPRLSVLCEILRNCYEAFALYCFGRYLVAGLGSLRELYRIVKFGIVQHMILKTLCPMLALILEIFSVYGDGEFKWHCGYSYMAIVMNFSQMWAMYCLV